MVYTNIYQQQGNDINFKEKKRIYNDADIALMQYTIIIYLTIILCVYMYIHTRISAYI